MAYEFNDLPRFDLGLTMAGAISAGAYTAGVVDFLIEAIDAWEAAKRAGDPKAPLHSIGLKVVSGASAGAVTGAVLAAALRYDFPHVRLKTPAAGAQNPLFDSWVNMIDIRHLLGKKDLPEGAKPISLLDSTRLLEVAQKAIDYGDGMPVIDRPYLGEPVRFIFTLTNLRGVPFSYSLTTGGTYGQEMSMHGDCMRFALTGLGQAGPSELRANEYQLSYPPAGAAKWSSWGVPFATAALASAAFPVGLAPRELARRPGDYDFIEVVVPGGDGQPAMVRTIKPSWNTINPKPQQDYRFAVVDGGTIDNEPLELARVELCDGDRLRRNERDGLTAKRAVIMVDPFTGPEAPGPQSVSELSLPGSVLSLFSALKNQARFRPEDVALAMDDTVFSRFLISPSRSGATQGTSGYAIACGSLGGFGGFLSRSFREHDYFLGRRNCQRFLERHLTLPEGNPLFARWSQDQKDFYQQLRTRPDGAAIRELPIIPLMKHLHPAIGEVEVTPPWPANACDPATLEDPIQERLNALYGGLVTETKGLLLWLGWRFYLRPKLTASVLDVIRKKLAEHGLL